MTQTLIDIGVNLTSKQFGHDREAVIERALEARVARMLVTGLSAPLSRQARELAKTRPGVLWSTAGVHPHNASGFTASTLGELKELLAAPEVKAAGECGLDYDRDFSPRPAQRRAFEKQLELAVDAKKPVFLHERQAHRDFVEMVSAARAGLVGGVVHCFTGTRAELERYLELGLCVGITGFLCDERRGTHLAELVARIPEDRLMVETDAPFLRPRDLPGRGERRNEPRYLPHVAAAVARHAGRDVAEVWRSTTKVACRLFGFEL